MNCMNAVGTLKIFATSRVIPIGCNVTLLGSVVGLAIFILIKAAGLSV